MRSFIHDLFNVHIWKLDHDTKFSKYYKCRCCDKRKVMIPSCDGYYNINKDWLGKDCIIEDYNKYN